MLKLYNVNKEKIEGLTKYKDLVKERDLKKGEDTLSFSYPKSLSRNIKEECYIETKFNFYVIKEIDNSDKDWINVVAKVNTEDLKSKTFPHFEMVNSYLKDTLNLALAGTGWTIGHNNIVKRRTVRVSNKTPLEVIDEIRKIYRTEIFFDAINKKVNVYEQLGEDKGDFFMENINLKSLNISSDSYDYVTRLIPLGKDGLTIEEINNGKKYVENYQYSDKIIYATWEDNRYTVVENLKEDAISKLEELSKPYKSYEADVMDLRGANLGDTITLISKTDEVKEKQRVVKITEYPDEPWNNKVEIANKTYTFEEMQSEVMDTVETADTVLTSDGMVDESKIDFNPIRQEFVTIIAEKADIVDLNAAVARIGDLEATKANVTDLEVVNAKIKAIETEDLTAINADITFLKNDVAEINHLLAGNITAENIAVGAITAGSGIIADGAIGDAQISSLSASKLSAGIIDAAIITVKNLNADNITVGTINGQRIADGAIDNSKVAEGANIAGSKLDINDVIININGAETQIDGTKIQVGDRTLDVELSTQKLAIDENSQEISNQRAQIQALDDAIKFKVDNQEFNQYKSVTDENITTINAQLSKNTSSVNVLQEEINLKVSQADVEKLINNIEIGGRNLIPNSETEKMGSSLITYDFNVNDIIDNIGEELTLSFDVKKEAAGTHVIDCYLRDQGTNKVLNPKSETYAIDESWQRIVYTFALQENIKGVEKIAVGIRCNKYVPGGEGNEGNIIVKKVQLEEGNKATTWTSAPEDFETEITAINTKVAKIDINLEGITSRVASTESNIVKVNDEVSAIESRVSSAEQKITDSAIVSTVRNSTAYINDLNNKANQSDLDITTSKITTLEQTSENFKISIKKYENGKLEGGYYNFTGEAAIFKGVGFVILNENLSSVLQGDVDGNLSMTGDFKAYRNAEKAIEIKGNNIYLYDWEGTTRRDPISRIFTGRRNSNPDQPALSLAHEEDAHISILHKNEYGSYSSYMDFDNYDRLGTNLSYPISLNRATLCKKDVLFLDKVRFRNNAVPWIQKNSGNSGLDFVISGTSNGGYSFRFASGTSMHSYLPGRDWPFIFNGHTRVQGNFTVTGSKNALIDTKNYGEVLVNAYETAEYYNGDLGSGKLGEDGLLYVYIDDIFDETVNTFMNYHITYGKCGPGEIYTYKKYPHYFIVKGEPGLEFTWELKAKRDGYEYDRLEAPVNLEEEEELDISYLIENEEEQADEKLKEIIEEELTFDLADYVLGGEEFENTY